MEPEEVQYLDFVTEGQKLARELRVRCSKHRLLNSKLLGCF